MSEEIRPALTAEEWRSGVKSSSKNLTAGQLSSVFTTPEGSVSLTVVAPGGGDIERITVGEDMRHALAALALHGQPFGFRREDVQLLQDLAAPPSMYYREDDRLMRLADTIAALLPPDQG